MSSLGRATRKRSLKIGRRGAGAGYPLSCLTAPPSADSGRIVAVGGTFDILHVGHERLLSKAFEIGDRVFIGVTSDPLVAMLHKKHRVRPYAARYNDVRAYLRSQGWLSRARVVKLHDPFGPAATQKRLDALVVSEETRHNGARLNKLREKNGLPPAKVFVVKLVKAKDGLPITSSRIRQGEIDRKGRDLRLRQARSARLFPRSR